MCAGVSGTGGGAVAGSAGSGAGIGAGFSSRTTGRVGRGVLAAGGHTSADQSPTATGSERYSALKHIHGRFQGQRRAGGLVRAAVGGMVGASVAAGTTEAGAV